MATFTTEPTRKAFHDAIAAVEAVSAIELVVTVRAHARRSLVPHAIVGGLCAIAVLGETLYADTEFDLWMIWILPLLGALIGGLIVEAAAPLYRALLPARVRREHVGEAARAAFYDLGVAATTRRTGLLAFVAVRERTVELLGDVGVARVLDRATLDRWAATVTTRMRDGGVATAQAVAALADDLARALPHVAGQVDELPDDLVVAHPRGARLGAAKAGQA